MAGAAPPPGSAHVPTLSIPVYPPQRRLDATPAAMRVPLAAAGALIGWILLRTGAGVALDPLPGALLLLFAAGALEGRASRLLTGGSCLLAELLHLALEPRPLRGWAAAGHLGASLALGATALLLSRAATRVREVRGQRIPAEVQARLDVIFEASGEAIALLDAEGVVRHASRSTPRILGARLHELVGTRLGERAHPDDAAAFDATFDRCLARPGEPCALHLRLRAGAGGFRHFEGVLTNELSDPNVEAVVFNYRDVNARHEAEGALRASERRYRELVEMSVAGFYLTDREGRFVDLNPALARMLGYASPRELIGMLDTELYLDPGVRRRGAALLLRQGSLSGFEIELRGRDGQARRFLGSANLVRSPEDEELIEGTLIDVTEHARAEERARLLDRMKRNFMVVASHEMRTPLTVVRGYLELMLEEERAHDGPRRRFLEVCETNLERLVTIVANITEVLAIEENRLQVAAQETDLAALLRGVIDEVRSFAAARGQTLALDAPERAPWQADPDKLRNALQQLVENAIKFTPDGGRIEVRLRATPVGIEFVVADNGVGIEAWEIEHIFEKFYAGAQPLHHGSGRFKFGARGPGLGLAIAKGYVEAHGGSIRAHSEGPGRGSTFHLELPGRQAAA